MTGREAAGRAEGLTSNSHRNRPGCAQTARLGVRGSRPLPEPGRPRGDPGARVSSAAPQARARGTGPCSLATLLDCGCHSSRGLNQTCQCPFSTPPRGESFHPSVPSSPLGSPLGGDIRPGPWGFPLPTPPPGRAPFGFLSNLQPSSLGLVTLSPAAARLGVLTADGDVGRQGKLCIPVEPWPDTRSELSP